MYKTLFQIIVWFLNLSAQQNHLEKGQLWGSTARDSINKSKSLEQGPRTHFYQTPAGESDAGGLQKA